eukprot:4154512-Amphidinium_carterae.1
MRAVNFTAALEQSSAAICYAASFCSLRLASLPTKVAFHLIHSIAKTSTSRTWRRLMQPPPATGDNNNNQQLLAMNCNSAASTMLVLRYSDKNITIGVSGQHQLSDYGPAKL